jgi:endonuclease I
MVRQGRRRKDLSSSGRRNAAQLPVDDWERHKTSIVKYYQGQKQTLQQLMPYMEREHGFFAT